MPQYLKTPSRHDGKINLEQQRKRAKALLKQLQNGGALNQEERLAKAGVLSNPRRLSDAQWLIARDLGFANWPKLKSHVDAITFAARHPGFDTDDETHSVHWRCGNDIAHTLRVAGFKGEFRMFTDPLCMGPVPDLPPLELQAVRNNYICHVFGMNEAESRQRLALEIIREAGPIPFGRVFAELMAKREPLPYLGDLMFQALLRPLIDAPAPLITEAESQRHWPERALALTPLGRQVLAGAIYWPDKGGLERWVGGVRIKSGHPHWAIDEDLHPVWRP